MNVVLPVNGTSIDEAEEIISKSSLVMTVAPKKVVDATAPLHNLSDFKISCNIVDRYIAVSFYQLSVMLRLCCI